MVHAPDADPVVVVGGGVVGSAAAYYLARSGVRVTLVERGRIGEQASGRNAGAIRQNGRSRGDLALAMASLELWRQFARSSPIDIDFRQTGDMVVALTPVEAARAERSCAIYRELGLHVAYITGAEARRLVPALSPAVIGAAYCPSDAQAYSPLAPRALALAAARAGAEICTAEPVTGLTMQDGRVTAVVTARRRIACRAVVVAAGPWAPQVAAMAGFNLPILPRRSQIMVTERAGPDTMLPFISGNGMYCRQTQFGNIVIGGGGLWENTHGELAGTVATPRRLALRFGQLFPGLQGLQIIRAFAGTVELTPDYLPFLGPVPGVAGLIMAAGLSGNGFALGPVMGHLVADLLLDRPPLVPIDGFRVDRFGPDCDYVAAYTARYAGLTEPVAW